MDLTQQATTLLNSVVAQFTALSWTLIVSTVGLAEVYAHRQRQKNIEKPVPWYFAALLGAVIGAIETLSHIKFGVDGFFWSFFQIVKSATIYAGLIPITYIIALKPFKALIELLQSKTEKK